MTNLIINIASFLLLSITASATVKSSDFTGSGNIVVLNSSDYSTASIADKVGCISAEGEFTLSECGLFTRLNVYPYTVSSTSGNCTFNDEDYNVNSDSEFKTPAFRCFSGYAAQSFDELYTVTGFNHMFLCNDDAHCYYDAKTTPSEDDTLSIWQFEWGSGQMGITPGHVQLLWLWVPKND